MKILESPAKVALYCLGIIFFALVLDGTLFQLWSLYHEHDRLEKNIHQVKIESELLHKKIIQAQGLDFIEKQARDQLDLVEEDEVVFVFSED